MNNNTGVVPFIESESSLVIPDFGNGELATTQEQFPFLVGPDVTDDELEEALIMASEYLCDYVNVNDDHLTTTIRGETHLQVLEAWGAILVKKQGMTFRNSKTGEEKQAYSVIFKLKDEKGCFSYLGFTSISAMQFMYRFVLGLPYIKGLLGDWKRPVRFSVKRVEAATGHTFSFKLVRGLQ